MNIVIDAREQELIKHIQFFLGNILKFKNIQVVVESLPIGDIIIKQNEEEKMYIERKSLNDLASSIKDGRYEEQSYRLNGLNIHNHNIVYLIEGDVNNINLFHKSAKNKIIQEKEKS
jgi:crossover junction endonuclease MUS81